MMLMNFALFLFFLHPLLAGDPPAGIQYSVPLQFTVNAGQWQEDILFGILNGKETLSLRLNGLYVEAPMPDEAGGGEMHPIEHGRMLVDRSSSLSFIGGNPRSVLGMDSLQVVSNFYFGSHSDSWYESVANHGRVVYKDVWPYIDVEYEAKENRLLQRIRYRPGADLSAACFLVTGAHMQMAMKTAINRGGIGEEAQMSDVQLVWSGDTVGYRLERGMVYNGYCLETEFTTFVRGLEGTHSEITDDSGEMTISGWARQGLPMKNSLPIDRPRFNCIVRFTCDGQDLLFSTYLMLLPTWDCRNYEHGKRLARDTDTSFFYLVNWMPTESDYIHHRPSGGYPPVSSNALQEYDTLWTSYLGRFSRTGHVLFGSTFGHRWETGRSLIFLTDIERADDGSLYLLGMAKDEHFPYVLSSALYPPTDEWGSYILRLGRDCDTVLAGTFFVPGNYGCFTTDIAIDIDGSILLAGQLDLGELPVTANAFQPVRPVPDPNPSYHLYMNRRDNFITRLSTDLDRIEYCSYLGGSRSEDASVGCGLVDHDSLGFFVFNSNHFTISHTRFQPRIIPDGTGGAIVAGLTRSADFPLLHPVQSEVKIDPLSSSFDGTLFITRFDRSGDVLFSTLYGGSDKEMLHQLQMLDCGRILLGGETRSEDFPLKNSAASRDTLLPDGVWINNALFLTVFNLDGGLHLSTLWGDAMLINFELDQAPSYMSGGYVFLADNLNATGNLGSFLLTPCNSFWFEPDSLGSLFSRIPISRYYFPLCDEDFLGCDLRAPGRVVIDTVRRSIVPARFPVRLTTYNPHESYIATGTELRLSLPAGLRLDSADQGAVRYLPGVIGPGDSSTTVWNVVVDTGQGLPDLSRIEVEQWYRIAGLPVNCLRSYSACALDMEITRGSLPVPELRCTVEMRDTLSNEERLLPLRLVLENVGTEHSGMLRATVGITGEGVTVEPTGDSTRTLGVGSGARHEEDWLLRADRRAWSRQVHVHVDVYDDYGRLPLACGADVFIEAAPGLSCALTGLAQLTADSSTGAPQPRYFTLFGALTNITDADVTGLEASLQWTNAPWLRIASGRPVRQTWVQLAARAKWETEWRMEATGMPIDTTAVDIRLMYRHAADTVWKFCTHQLTAYPRRTELACDLWGTDSVRTVGGVPVPQEMLIQCQLRNDGSVSRTISGVELQVPGTAGVTLLDAARQSGGALSPGGNLQRQWQLRAQALRPSRIPVFEVHAYEKGTSTGMDSLVSVCTHAVFIEGMDGLICSMPAIDTVCFNRAMINYEPDTVMVQFDLENLLDTEETNIEAVIDLTQASRLVLPATEPASKTIAAIDSHATASLMWKLLPQAAPVAEDQQVTVRYRSDQMTEWKECTATIHIEAWPEEPGITCETGGHDSLFADWHEERFIPNPLHLSYTVTNTGTVALTGCEASIILPPEFSLAGSDSTQSFTSPEYANQPGGPAPEGTLLPGASCSRWWKITPAQNIADTDPRLITWIWKSNEQGTESGCTHIVYIIPDNPPGLVLTPLHLYFEAERGGALPVEQQVQLWTGGGLAMPWTAQPSEWWLDAQPTSGSQSTQISVQPNSTLLDVGAHGADLLFAATPTDRHVAITYVIRKSTGIESPATPGALTLDAWPQPVPAGARLYVHIGGEAGGSCRVTLHDLLGRERLTRYAETASPVVLDLGALQLSTGVYLLRAIADNGAQATRMISVTGGR
ncbi:T9SS type A sorting domain-containing protein [bacterium]|nr:T9SS type A sorting domain-containing protein [bacterium]